MPLRRAAGGLIIGLVILMSLPGCSRPSSTPGITDHAIVTFQVADERFKVELITRALVEHAEALLEGQAVPALPIGVVVREDPGVNAPWSWHIDPAQFEFGDVATEICDGRPSYVEKGAITSPYFCPVSAKVVAVDPLP